MICVYFLNSPTIFNRGEPAGFEASENCRRQCFYAIIVCGEVGLKTIHERGEKRWVDFLV